MEGDQLSQTEYKEGGGLLTANVEGRGGVISKLQSLIGELDKFYREITNSVLEVRLSRMTKALFFLFVYLFSSNSCLPYFFSAPEQVFDKHMPQ